MPSTRVHAVSDDALGDHDAVDLAALVRSREVSPGELAAAAVARARRVEPALNALVLERFDEAIATAESLPEGPFRGVPTFIKDMSDLTGYPTRWGSDALAGAGPADHDAPEVAQLLAMGTNVLGKTTMPDFGIICSAEYPDGPPTRNPWNTGHTPGGSSSGAAAMVAAGVVPLAHAADGGGSIRIPAAACGLVGLKPTRGRIAEDVTGKVLPVRVTSHGVVTRTVRDSWAYLAAAEQQFRPRSLQPIGPIGAPLSSTLRIGYITDTSNGAAIDAATRRVQDETVALLESLGHQVEHMANPISASLADDFILYYGFLALMIATGGRKLFDPSFDRSALTPVVRGFGDHCRQNLAKLPGAIRRLRRSTAEASALFVRNDVLVTPTVGQVAPLIGHFDTALPYDELLPRVAEWACFTPWNNVTGHPAVSLPMGHDEVTGLPIGMMFHADGGRERLLLELAAQLEQAQPFRRIDAVPTG